MQPENSIRIPIACDLSQTALEEAIIMAEENRKYSDVPIGYNYCVVIHKRSLFYANSVCEHFLDMLDDWKVHIRTRNTDDVDEWYLEAKYFFLEPPHAETVRIWSPGA